MTGARWRCYRSGQEDTSLDYIAPEPGPATEGNKFRLEYAAGVIVKPHLVSTQSELCAGDLSLERRVFGIISLCQQCYSSFFKEKSIYYRSCIFVAKRVEFYSKNVVAFVIICFVGTKLENSN